MQCVVCPNCFTQKNQLTIFPCYVSRHLFNLNSQVKIFNLVAKLLTEYKNVPYRDLRILFFIEDLLNFNQLTNGLHKQKILSVIISQILKRNVFLVMPALYVIFMKLKRQSLKSK